MKDYHGGDMPTETAREGTARRRNRTTQGLGRVVLIFAVIVLLLGGVVWGTLRVTGSLFGSGGDCDSSCATGVYGGSGGGGSVGGSSGE